MSSLQKTIEGALPKFLECPIFRDYEDYEGRIVRLIVVVEENLKILKMCAGLMLLEQWEATIENQVVVERRQECHA